MHSEGTTKKCILKKKKIKKKLNAFLMEETSIWY